MFWAVLILASILGALLLFIAFGVASRKAPDALMGQTGAQTVSPVAKAAPVQPLPQTAHTDEPMPIITGAFASEPEFDEAELMLREVKAMLLQGRPDRAIAHIRTVAGVEEHLAAEFVEEVQQGLLG